MRVEHRVIAARDLVQGARRVRVEICEPKDVQLVLDDPHEVQIDSQCTWRIIGLEHPVEGAAAGVDAIQALVHALEMARVRLSAEERSHGPLTWDGGDWRF